MTVVSTEPWLDKRGVAQHFSCSVRSIEGAMTRGLPYATIFGRPKFRASEVEAWLERHGALSLHGERGDSLPSPDDARRAA